MSDHPPLQPSISLEDQLRSRIDAVLAARNADPFAVLGPQPTDSPQGRRWVVRFFQPRAVEAEMVVRDYPEPIPMHKIRPEGFFEATFPGTRELAPEPSSYRIRFRTEYGETQEQYDTYAFPFLLTEFDIYLMGEGRHYDAYEKLGAHLRTVDGVPEIGRAHV